MGWFLRLFSKNAGFVRLIAESAVGVYITKVFRDIFGTCRLSPFYLPSLGEQNPASTILILECLSQSYCCSPLDLLYLLLKVL
jgi:hypothetical protein